MKRAVFGLGLASVLALFAGSAQAYIGPGSGISLLGGLWGVLVAIVLAVGAILIWPIRYVFRRLRRKFRGAREPESVQPTDTVEAERSSRPSE